MALALSGCSGERTSQAAQPAAASAPRPSLEAVAIAAHRGPASFGVPLYPEAREAVDMTEFMRDAWTSAGEPDELFSVRLGEHIYETDAPFESVREFYLPFVTKVFMDHETEFPGIGSQWMFTGLMVAPDSTLVKFTVTRPFFRYPDQAEIDRTVIQLGRVGRTP